MKQDKVNYAENSFKSPTIPEFRSCSNFKEKIKILFFNVLKAKSLIPRESFSSGLLVFKNQDFLPLYET